MIRMIKGLSKPSLRERMRTLRISFLYHKLMMINKLTDSIGICHPFVYQQDKLYNKNE